LTENDEGARCRLAANYTVQAVDRRGRGASGDGPDWSLALDARDLAAIARQLDGIPPVVGHSLGGIVALEAASRTDAFGPVVAYEPPIHADEGPGMEAADDLERTLHEQGSEAAVAAFLREVGYGDEQFARLKKNDDVWQATVDTAPTLVREARADLAYTIDEETMGEIGQAVLLLSGEAGSGEFDPALDRLAKLVPDAERGTIQGAGHGVLYEAPGAFAGRVEAFLDEQLGDR
jgi:pimeloyl-ACP methyl ester carboxylesterase